MDVAFCLLTCPQIWGPSKEVRKKEEIGEAHCHMIPTQTTT